MTELKTTTNNSWTRTQVIALVAFSLLLGVCGGWLIRRSLTGQVRQNLQASPASAVNVQRGQPTSTNLGSASADPTTEQLKQVADTQAAPLLEQLKTDSNNAALLTRLGNLYYDAKQYSVAIDYYERCLKLQPSDTSVRTDLGTAYWYEGDADKAIKEFEQALADEPNKANALFNLGIVKWKAKHDAADAIADWQKLLVTNPGFEARVKVEQLIAEVQGSAPQKP